MNYGEDIFKTIINYPEMLRQIPEEYKHNIEFLETFYIILGDEIKPYISKNIYEALKRREISFKNQYLKPKLNKPKISLESELEILHNILTDPQAIETLPTDEKYTSACLEFLYLIWGDEIKPYIPYDMFEELKNEELMKQYHRNYHNECENWANEENDKVLAKKKK